MKFDITQPGLAAIHKFSRSRMILGLLLLVSACLLAACATDPALEDLSPTTEAAPATEPAAITATEAAPEATSATTTAAPTTPAPGMQALPPTPAKAMPTRSLPGGLEQVQPTAGTPVVGEVPNDLLDPILDDLASRLGIDRGSILVIQAESVVWNDGSLGCPNPGEVYTQALVDGYHVVLQAGDQTYDYRASEGGYFFLCERGDR